MTSQRPPILKRGKLPREDSPPTPFDRRLPRRAIRDGLQSLGGSLLFHGVLLFVLMGWMLIRPPVFSGRELLVSELDDKPEGLEKLVDVPLALEEIAKPETKPPEPAFATQENPPPLTGVSLPKLRKDTDPKPNPKPKSKPAKPIANKPMLAGTANADVEREVQKRLDQAGGQSGAVRISLIWNNGNDLDLYVKTPVGDIVAFNYKKSRCGGELDVDMNAKKVQSTEPVENVFWSEKKVPTGVFLVGVHQYQNHGYRDPSKFLVSVKVAGEVHHFRSNQKWGQKVQCVCQFRRTAKGVEFMEPPDEFSNRPGKPVFK